MCVIGMMACRARSGKTPPVPVKRVSPVRMLLGAFGREHMSRRMNDPSSAAISVQRPPTAPEEIVAVRSHSERHVAFVSRPIVTSDQVFGKQKCRSAAAPRTATAAGAPARAPERKEAMSAHGGEMRGRSVTILPHKRDAGSSQSAGSPLRGQIAGPYLQKRKPQKSVADRAADRVAGPRWSHGTVRIVNLRTVRELGLEWPRLRCNTCPGETKGVRGVTMSCQLQQLR